MTAHKKQEKNRQDVLQLVLTEILKDEDNKYCADCEAKGPRWASWNLGIFLCIRCAGHHRNLGVHISRVRSVNLDSWTDDQVSILQQMGNRRARLVYESLLPENFRRPQTDYALEQFIRAKYEHRRYIDRSMNWEPPKAKPLVLPAAASEDQHHHKKASSIQLSGLKLPHPVLGKPLQLPQAQKQRPASSTNSQEPHHPVAPKPQKDLFDLFDNDLSAQPQTNSLTSGVASIQLSPVEKSSQAANAVASPDSGLHQSSTQSDLDELQFLSSQPVASHPQQHQQRSVSNYDLMSIMSGTNTSNNPQQQNQQSSNQSPAAASSSSGLDDILSLYKQTPAQNNFGAPVMQMFGQQHQAFGHQRNFSDAAVASGMFGATQPFSQQAAPLQPGGFGSFQQQQLQQPSQMAPMQGFPSLSIPSNNMFGQSGFEPMVAKPNTAPVASATTANPSSMAFDAIWQ